LAVDDLVVVIRVPDVRGVHSDEIIGHFRPNA
jgi:hypothetical protein